MFFKKFRQGIDMRKNKIINSFVDNPVTDNEIANKNYVDQNKKEAIEKQEQLVENVLAIDETAV